MDRIKREEEAKAGAAAFESIPVWARMAIEELEKKSEEFERRIYLLECKIEKLKDQSKAGAE